MRRLMMTLGLVALTVLTAAGIAMAVVKTADTVPFYGTNNDDMLYERIGTKHDRIYGQEGEDVIDANTFNFDRDVLYGGDQGDKLLVNDGDGRDVVRGGKGRDVAHLDKGDRAVNIEVVRRNTAANETGVAGDVSEAYYR